MKSFKDYLEGGVVKRRFDNKSKALKEESMNKFFFLEQTAALLSEQNANTFVELTYDAIMLLLRAKLSEAGYKAQGLGAHEAEIAFFEDALEKKELAMLDKLRYYRNGSVYYGEKLTEGYAKKVIAFAKEIKEKLV
ncbi:hypothetical protein GOV10_00545 [Candidatus Woesearchaeota archaeon]|nr:hypothetical protein [Candidatus Woesearchaeota archaeon]